MSFKKNALIGFSFLLIISCTKKRIPTNSSNDGLSKGLIAYYPFNGDTKDATGNCPKGKLLNNAELGNDNQGKPASALNCRRGGDGLLIKHSGKFNFDTAITVSLNVMLRDYLPNCILDFVNYEAGTAQKFSIGNSTLDNGTHFGMFVADNNDVCSSITYLQNGPYHILTSKEVYETGRWYNVICTFKNGAGKIYVNGILTGTATFPNSLFSICSNADLLIGSWVKNAPNAAASSTNGSIDEVRLYNRELSTNEIQKLSSMATR